MSNNENTTTEQIELRDIDGCPNEEYDISYNEFIRLISMAKQKLLERNIKEDSIIIVFNNYVQYDFNIEDIILCGTRDLTESEIQERDIEEQRRIIQRKINNLHYIKQELERNKQHLAGVNSFLQKFPKKLEKLLNNLKNETFGTELYFLLHHQYHNLLKQKEKNDQRKEELNAKCASLEKDVQEVETEINNRNKS